MTAYAAVVSLTNTMKQIQSHPRLSFAFDNKQIEFLFEKLGSLLHHIKGNSHGGSKEVELERLIARAAHAAEDKIESHIVDQVRAAGTISLLDLGSLLTTFDSPMKEVVEFEKEKESNNVEQIGSADELIQQPMKRLLSSNDVHQTTHTMIGFEEELNQLLEMLIGQQSSRQIIPIVGMGGIGTEEELGEKLHKKLCGRRYLIVLDDLWSVEAWEKIMFFFPDNSVRSRVVVTTRLSNMATYFGSSCLAKKFLEKDKSWNLFQEKAFGQQGCPPELEEIGMEIAKKCKGLPLSISVIGGFLGKSPMTREYWENVATDINSVLNSEEDDHEQCSNILSTSYIHLPAHLKPCFLYMGVFREDEKIHVSRLIKLWVSEGFLEPNEAQTFEEIAEGYVNDLVDRNLIIVSKWEVSGKIRNCNVHDVLRDLCLRICEREKFLRVIHPFNLPQDVASDRRLVLPGGVREPLREDESRCYYCPEDFEALRSASLARSLIVERARFGLELRLLRVSENFDWWWYKGFTDQVNLRYLSIFNKTIWTYSENIEDIELGELPMWNLQTFKGELNARSTYFNPLAIWEMRQLRHLEVYDLYLTEPPSPQQQQHGGFVLRNLQTLERVVDLRLSAEVCRRIPNVRSLDLTYKDFSYDCLGNLDQLHKLESLRLKVRGKDFLRADLFPSALRKLTLRQCVIRWEELALIGCCPNLEVLKLSDMVGLVGSEWSPVEGQFLRLKKLTVDNNAGDNRLIRWNADRTHFPVLEKLVLFNLCALEEIPSGIGDIPTLRHIYLIGPTYSAALSALRILQEQLDNSGYEDFQVRVRFWKHTRLERFKELMESESFTCKNVQLSSNH